MEEFHAIEVDQRKLTTNWIEFVEVQCCATDWRHQVEVKNKSEVQDLTIDQMMGGCVERGDGNKCLYHDLS